MLFVLAVSRILLIPVPISCVMLAVVVTSTAVFFSHFLLAQCDMYNPLVGALHSLPSTNTNVILLGWTWVVWGCNGVCLLPRAIKTGSVLTDLSQNIAICLLVLLVLTTVFFVWVPIPTAADRTERSMHGTLRGQVSGAKVGLCCGKPGE
jgi:hypothetical protein